MVGIRMGEPVRPIPRLAHLAAEREQNGQKTVRISECGTREFGLAANNFYPREILANHGKSWGAKPEANG